MELPLIGEIDCKKFIASSNSLLNESSVVLGLSRM